MGDMPELDTYNDREYLAYIVTRLAQLDPQHPDYLAQINPLHEAARHWAGHFKSQVNIPVVKPKDD